MKVPHYTDWETSINKTLSEKPIDKIEENNRELSQYSSVSNWTGKHSWQGKDRSLKSQKRHRFPPSLLTTRAADFWKTLMPLRANCSCSSISSGVEHSRLSFGVSFSDTTVGSSENSLSPFNEVAAPENFGETLKCTQQAFELLIARMVKLMNISNEGSNLSSTRLFSDSNFKITPPLRPEPKNTADIIVGDSYCGFSSITSISNNSTDRYYENSWLPSRIKRRWQSSSTFEIPERRNCVKKPFSQNPFEISKTVLSEEELIYLLRYKRSLISEYFQCKVDSENLKKKLDTSEQKSLIYATQSDSRLQERSLVRFVQFVRSRKREAEGGNESKENTLAIDNSGSKTDDFSIPKRRVTFSNPLAESSSSCLNCFSVDDEEGISSVESLTSAIEDDVEKPFDDYAESRNSSESKSSSDLNSSVFPEACLVDLDPNPPSTTADDVEKRIVYMMNFGKSIRERKVAKIEAGGDDHSRCDISNTKMTKEESGTKVDVVVTIPVKKLRSFVQNEDRHIKSPRSHLADSLTLRKSIRKDIGVIEEKNRSKSPKFLMEEALDCGTTHMPISNEVEGGETCKKVDDGIRRVTFEGRRSQHRNSEISFEKIDMLGENREPLENESVVNESNEISEKSTRFISYSDESEIGNPEYNCHPVVPSSGKTVTFQDYYQTINDEEESIEQSLRSDDGRTCSSVDTGWFELAWKGCWENKNGRNLKQCEEREMILPKIAEYTVIEKQKEEPEELSGNRELFATPCSRRSSYYTAVEGNDEIERGNDCGSIHESSFIFTADANGREKDEVKDDIPKASKPVSKFSNDLRSDTEAINLPNRGDLAREFGDVYERIRNPEIWRSEVRTLAKPDWFTACDCDRYSCGKKTKTKSDWLIRRLEELKTSPEPDYESDYYADSEVDSDFEWTRDFPLLNRSLSEIDVRSERRRKLGRTNEDREKKNVFLEKVLSGRKLFFGGCRCRNNCPSTSYDLKSRDFNLRHTSFRDSDEERSRRKLFSNIRAKIILDSETEDSDNFSPSIPPEFPRDFNRRDEYVNKIKCRRFVKSLRSVGGGLGILSKSNYDRQFSSSGLLHVAFERSFNPASVQTERSTRTVATNIFEEQDHCSAMDVCVDTNDLQPRKSIGTINRASDFILENEKGDNQTREALFEAPSSPHGGKNPPEPRRPVLIQREKLPGSNSQEYKNSGRKLSNAIENLSVQINNASNNLAKLRFSEVETSPESGAVSPSIKEGNFNAVERFETCQGSIQEGNKPTTCTFEILSTIPGKKIRVENPAENISKDSSPRLSDNSNCPICSNGKKSTARYLLPACVVKGAAPDQRINEKDPWNRVMERAKIQHRYEGQDAAKSSKFLRNDEKLFLNDESQPREESMTIHRPSGVEENSTGSINRGEDHPAGGLSKISSPSSTAPRQRRSFFSPVRSSTPFHFLLPNLAGKSSSRKMRKPQAVATMSNRLLYIISEKAELIHQTSIKLPAAANFFTHLP